MKEVERNYELNANSQVEIIVYFRKSCCEMQSYHLRKVPCCEFIERSSIINDDRFKKYEAIVSVLIETLEGLWLKVKNANKNQYCTRREKLLTHQKKVQEYGRLYDNELTFYNH